MNFRSAVTYLQALITEPESVAEDGSRDFGWCCSEHALVLALALNICELDATVAQGSVKISLPNEFSQLVYRHWFVVTIGTAEVFRLDPRLR